MNACKPAVVALASLLSAGAQAAEADTAPVAAMGGAGVANPYDNGALRRNSAALMMEEVYQAQVDLGFARGWRGQASIRDTRTSQLGAGVSYTRHTYDPAVDSADMPGWVLPDSELSNHTVAESWRLGVGASDKDHMFALGGGLVWDRTSEELGGRSHGLELDASLAARLGSRVLLGAAAHDLMPEPEEGDESIWGMRPISGELGAWVVTTENLGLTGEGVMTAEGDLGGRAGAQIGASDTLHLRAGGSWIAGDWAVAGGFGALGEQTTLNYALQYDLAAKNFWHTVGVTAVF